MHMPACQLRARMSLILEPNETATVYIEVHVTTAQHHIIIHSYFSSSSFLHPMQLYRLLSPRDANKSTTRFEWKHSSSCLPFAVRLSLVAASTRKMYRCKTDGSTKPRKRRMKKKTSCIIHPDTLVFRDAPCLGPTVIDCHSVGCNRQAENIVQRHEASQLHKSEMRCFSRVTRQKALTDEAAAAAAPAATNS